TDQDQPITYPEQKPVSVWCNELKSKSNRPDGDCPKSCASQTPKRNGGKHLFTLSLNNFSDVRSIRWINATLTDHKPTAHCRLPSAKPRQVVRYRSGYEYLPDNRPNTRIHPMTTRLPRFTARLDERL